MNKEDFIKMIKPFTIPEMETVMGEGLEIFKPSTGDGVKINHKLLFINNVYLVYSTDKEHYFFKFRNWHNIKTQPFNPNMEWGDGMNDTDDVELLHVRPYPINTMNGGDGWACVSYQIIPNNYLLKYFGIGPIFMNWGDYNPWEGKP